jgi:hypothetical protein
MQDRVKTEAKRFNVVACGRRFGKTTLGIDLIVHELLQGYPAAWFSPTYKMLSNVWTEIQTLLRPISSRVSVQEKRIELFTGAVFDMWSLDSPNVARGRKYKRAVIDEAAMVTDLERAFYDVIRPTLADYAGDAWLLSTPKGRNFFWKTFQFGQDASNTDWKSWRFTTGSNPYISPAEIESMRSTMPERSYQQEIEARFLDDGGGVFRGVRSVATSVAGDAHEAHTIVAGVDWSGGGADYTVVTVFDATEKREIHKERFSGLDWGMNEARVEAVLRRFNVMVALGEDNGMGGPLNNNLRRKGLRVRDFHTSHETKAEIIEGLVIAFERGDIHILPDETTINELESFETSRLPSGSVRYAAPDGMHDDTVMSMALAWRAVNGSKGFSFG